MCGIVGVMSNGLVSDKTLALFQGLLFLDKVRGDHATGVTKINPWSKMVKTYKKAVGAQKFLGDDDALEFMDKERGRIYIGHNRYATMGDKSKDENAHPFTEEHITMVHNGGVDRWTLEDLEGYGEEGVSVDSHMVCKTIAKLGIAEAVKKLSGAFALVWWDSNEHTLNFIRNADRPMWLAALSDGTLVWASEREFIDFFVNRKKNNLTYKEEPREIPKETLITYTFNEHGVLQNGGSCKATHMEFANVPDPKPVTRYYGGSSTGVNYSQQSYDRRANHLLKWWKIDAQLGDTIICKVVKLHECQDQNRVDVEMEFEGVTVMSYYVPKSMADGAKWMEGPIANAFEKKLTLYGTSYNDLHITISQANLKRHVEKPTQTVIHKKVTTSSSATFPLKVNGHTFPNRDEFVDFVSTGCSLCGKVPTSFDPLNKNLSVYQLDHFSGLLKDCEFVCGHCVQESEPKK